MADEIVTRNPDNFAKELWLLKTEKMLCDAALIVNGETIPVHSVVMASSSTYFKSIFVHSGMKEISFKDIEKDTMMELIQYCYTGKIKITEKNASEVFKMAKLLSIITVFESYASTLEKNLNVSNCLSTWKIAQLGDMAKLKSASLDFARKNFVEVSHTDGFLNLKYSEVHELLSSGMNEVSASIIYNAIKNWTKHIVDSRKAHLAELLEFVKLTCLPHDDLVNESLLICKLDGVCFQKFMDAIKSQKNANVSECSSKINTLVAICSQDHTVSQTIEVFNLISEEWTEIKGITNFNKQYSTALFLDEKLLMIGGYFNGSDLNTVESYNLKTNQQETLTPMNYARRHLTAVQLKDYIYAIGGYNNTALSFVEKWNGSSKSWTNVAPMNFPRYLFGADVLGDEIFVVGGLQSTYIDLVESYNLSTNKWTNRKSMKEKKYGAGVTAIGSYLYVVGGYSGQYLNTVEKYDPINDNWTSIQSLQTINHRMGIGNLSGKLVIAGGNNSSGNLSTVEIYDESTGNWKHMAPLKNPRYDVVLVTVPWNLAENALSKKLSK